jgi:hypothetical protein
MADGNKITAQSTFSYFNIETSVCYKNFIQFNQLIEVAKAVILITKP